MATNMIQQTTGRGGQGQSRANQRAKRYLLVGILGGAILLALAVGIAVRQGDGVQAVTEAPAAVVPSNATVGVSYRLSAPNELDTDTTGAIPANSAPTGYRVSFPNEANPDGIVTSSAIPANSGPAVYRVIFPNESNPDGTVVAPASYAPYRVSAPNEQEPSVP